MKQKGWNLKKGQPDGRKGRSAGGKAVAELQPPEVCPCCGRSSKRWKSYHNWLGHRGLNVAAENAGMTPEAFLRVALMNNDPAPWNGAWQR